MNSLIRVSKSLRTVGQMNWFSKFPIRSLYKAAIPSITSAGADPCAHYTLTADYRFDLPISNLPNTDSPYSGPSIQFDSAIIRDITDRCWNPFNTETSYQPAYLSLEPFKLSKDDQKIIFQVSDLAYFGADKMHQKLFSRSLKKIDGDQFYRILYDCVHDYLSETDDGLKTKKAQSLNDAFIAIGWLEKYWLFEGFGQKMKTNFIIPEVIAKSYSLLAVLFGNQTEFLYYGHYVGASCSNMQDMRDMMSQVDFENQDSIATWLKSFDALYDVQSEYDSTLGDEPIDSVLQSDRTFRFIHLAMEMVFSRDIKTIHSLFDQALLTTGAEQKQLIQEALDLMNQTEIDMHAIFKTLPKVSKPSHYNPFVRPFIAGTFGGNCGTVYHEKGKFFVGCGDDTYLDPNTAVLY
ncbi:MAG: hypothetical protein VXX85_05185, partial [Candidatus Margulisiibacteriota bacterium]|nr:hypothetical protein [Candidatus Margulisiibacteriota bacterium]